MSNRPEIPSGGGSKGKRRARVPGHSPQMGQRDKRRLAQGKEDDQGQALGFDQAGRPKVKIKAGSPLRVTPQNELDVELNPQVAGDVSVTTTIVGGGRGGGTDPGDGGAEVGPQGPRGLTGDRGAPGRQGPEGGRGKPGPPGPSVPGTTGLDGSPGAMGPPGRGRTGAEGPRGKSIPGVQGSQGTPGSDGAQGLTGHPIPGRDGGRGRRGFPGGTGPTGATGQAGGTGSTGATGATGQVGGRRRGIQGPRGRSRLGAKGDLGATGTTGAQGVQGFSLRGRRGMDGSRGRSIPGVRGADGAAGTPGGTGAQGPQGIPGLTFRGRRGDVGERGRFAPGINGLNGATGSTGAQGIPGLTFRGRRGADGARARAIPGARGLDGVIGVNGADGIAGARGRRGAAGASARRSHAAIPIATKTNHGSVILANDLEYTANEVIRADDIRITTSLFKQRHMQLLPRFKQNGSTPTIDAVGMPVPTISGTGTDQFILGNAYAVIRFIANAGANSYRMYLDTGTPANTGGVVRTGFNATCGWMIQTGITHTAIRMWLGLTDRDLHAIGTPTGNGPSRAAVAAFRYDTGVDTTSTNWRAVTTAISAGSVSGVTVTDTGVDAAVNGGGYAFVIQTSVTAITFWINGAIVAVHTTNLPTDLNLGHTVSVTTLDATNKRLDWGRSFYFHSEFGF